MKLIKKIHRAYHPTLNFKKVETMFDLNTPCGECGHPVREHSWANENCFKIGCDCNRFEEDGLGYLVMTMRKNGKRKKK
jgi:hypothetical protein